VNRTIRILIAARGVRAFGDGFVALLLPAYLLQLGYGPVETGVLASATLLGSSGLTLGAGFLAHRIPPRRLLLMAAGLMLATGLAFSQLRQFWPMVVVGFVGTLNPSSGDVSPFQPLEQAQMADAAPPGRRTDAFAIYGLVGALAAAFGALCLGLSDRVATASGISPIAASSALFVLYGFLGLVLMPLYSRLPAAGPQTDTAPTPLGPSRPIVLRLAALFSLDAFGGGFLVNTMLALWLFQRFEMSLATAGLFFFWAGLLSAFSQLAAGRLARRIGLINTMVFTHLPANLAVALAAFAPNLTIALVLLSIRAALSQMDVPARNSYVMAVVTPAERAAAASLTNVPRSLASAVSPSLAGLMFAAAPFAWFLVVGGGLKAVYDVLLLMMFRSVRPPEETASPPSK
jgi:MFS family permease